MNRPSRQITKVAVLGAGTMGSRIAAHIANAGVPVVLLDLVPPSCAPDAPHAERTKIVLGALEALKKLKPAAFFSAAQARLVTPGNFEDDMALISGCDWIIEVVAESLEIKRALLRKVLEHRRPGTITTTNTSGLPIAEIVEGLEHAQAVGREQAQAPGPGQAQAAGPGQAQLAGAGQAQAAGPGQDRVEDLKRHWFGTHFFNPPRYMRLLEIIPTPAADPEAVALIASFSDQRLGKANVHSFDQPNFIANRIGTFSLGNKIRLMQAQGLTIEEVDTLTGAPLGWPKSGTFRLGDMVGVDILAHVAKNFEAQAERIHDERPDVVLAPFITRMLEKEWLGDKAGQGFYKKAGRDQERRDLRHVLDWQTLSYREATRPKFLAIELARPIEQTAARIRQLLHADPARDRAAAFFWPLLTELFTYAANRVAADGSQPAADIVAIDQAMKTGFNWELGPFEMMDAAGVRETTEKMKQQGLPIAQHVETLLAAGLESWNQDDPAAASGRRFFDPLAGVLKPVPAAAGVCSLAAVKQAKGVVRKNPGASVIDLGNGAAAIELHSKMNALGGDIVSLVTETLKPGSDLVRDFNCFVITGDSANFSVGANLMQLLLSVQEEEWDEVERAVRKFQNMTQAIKFCPRPVVVAPFGMCLGGGVEMALHAAARQASAELYMGLVEAGVGLIPGGGGSKEMVLRTIEAGSSIRPDARGEGVEIFEALRKNFESIARATVSTSAVEARDLGYLRASDAITMNRERLVSDAAARAAALAAAGFSAPVPRTDIPAPGENALATLKLAVWTLREGQFISEHDAKVANWAAYVLCGGKLTPGTPVSEQYLLDLEREAFLSLCGEKKTQERIAFTLKTGKPLRN